MKVNAKGTCTIAVFLYASTLSFQLCKVYTFIYVWLIEDHIAKTNGTVADTKHVHCMYKYALQRSFYIF